MKIRVEWFAIAIIACICLLVFGVIKQRESENLRMQLVKTQAQAEQMQEAAQAARMLAEKQLERTVKQRVGPKESAGKKSVDK